MWKRLKRNYGWVITLIIGLMPMLMILSVISVDFSDGFSISYTNAEGRNRLHWLIHETGELAILWMVSVLTLTPIFILFGMTNIFVRQAMGLLCGWYSVLHVFFFIQDEGMAKIFTQFNFVAGFVALLILIPMMLTSNRKAIRKLKGAWKRMHKLVYIALFLTLVHVAILDKSWVGFAVVVGIGFLLRVPQVKDKVISFRKGLFSKKL
ncbi:MAG: sulfoxide reductase heme-binding subunit YedZ [Sphingobacteriales bacterium]|jgi:sulfoxide reductase heme-binding subunit YedZ